MRQGPGLRESARAFPSERKIRSAPSCRQIFRSSCARELESRKSDSSRCQRPLLAGARSEIGVGTAPDAQGLEITESRDGARDRSARRSKPVQSAKARMVGRRPDVGAFCARKSTPLFCAPGVCRPTPSSPEAIRRAIRMNAVTDRSKRTASSSSIFSARGGERLLWRPNENGGARPRQRRATPALGNGQCMARRSRLKKMKPGVDGLKLHKEVKQFFADRGYPTEVRNGRQTGFFHGTGHGLGLEIHEFPRFPENGFQDRPGADGRTGLYYPGLGGTRPKTWSRSPRAESACCRRFENELGCNAPVGDTRALETSA